MPRKQLQGSLERASTMTYSPRISSAKPPKLFIKDWDAMIDPIGSRSAASKADG